MSHVYLEPDGEAVVVSREQPESLLDVLAGFEASHAVFPMAGKKKVITLSTEDTVSHALQTLAKEGILSAPIVSSNGIVIGVASVLHFLSYFVRHFSSEELRHQSFSELEAKRSHLLHNKITEVPDLQALDTAHVIKEYQVILDAVKLMIDNKDPARRVLVVDDNERLVTIITQSRMLEIIAGVLDSLPDPAHRTLREVNLHKKDVACVKKDQPAADAFSLMREKKVSAVAVVDDDQRLVGAISASDFKMMGYEIKYLNLLGMSANEYVEVLRGSVDQEDLCVCQPEATISHTIKLMLKRGTHRVFVVDQQCRVKSVVSISDVMRALVDPFMT